MPEIEVDGSVFSFPTGWEVEAYDTWAFVRKIAGGTVQAKACDIVGISGSTLHLIEAKDYTYPVGTRPPPLSELTATIAQKAFHTLAGLHAGARHSFEKQDFCVRALECVEIKLCLSIELPSDKGRLYGQQQVLVQLRELLYRASRVFLDSRAVVVSHSHGNPPWSANWTAARRTLTARSMRNP